MPRCDQQTYTLSTVRVPQQYLVVLKMTRGQRGSYIDLQYAKATNEDTWRGFYSVFSCIDMHDPVIAHVRAHGPYDDTGVLLCYGRPSAAGGSTLEAYAFRRPARNSPYVTGGYDTFAE